MCSSTISKYIYQKSLVELTNRLSEMSLLLDSESLTLDYDFDATGSWFLESSISKYEDRHTHPKARHIAIYTKHKKRDEESNHLDIKYRNSSGPIRNLIRSEIRQNLGQFVLRKTFHDFEKKIIYRGENYLKTLLLSFRIPKYRIINELIIRMHELDKKQRWLRLKDFVLIRYLIIKWPSSLHKIQLLGNEATIPRNALF